MYLHSVSAYVDQIIDQLDASSIQVLKSIPEEKLSALHHGWGTSIRNTFGLWKEDHPLTTNWHKNPDQRDMRVPDGGGTLICDCSLDHPDSVSMLIMQGVWKKVNA